MRTLQSLWIEFNLILWTLHFFLFSVSWWSLILGKEGVDIEDSLWLSTQSFILINLTSHECLQRSLHTTQDASMIKTESRTNLLYINMYIYRQLDKITISNTPRVYLGYIIPSHEFLNMFTWDEIFTVEQVTILISKHLFSGCVTGTSSWYLSPGGW